MGRIADTERALYEDAWSLPQYRKWSPGLDAVPRFLRLTGAAPPATVLDFGCGAGVAGADLLHRGFRATLVDQTDAGIADPTLPFLPHCLWRPWTGPHADYGFCVDVLEHIPTELTALTIARMVAAVDVLYLELATVPDGCGVLVGQTLHKTVQPFTWWLALCRELATVSSGLDLLDRAVFILTP